MANVKIEYYIKKYRFKDLADFRLGVGYPAIESTQVKRYNIYSFE